jgi:energy-converting hydrogenase Eha subunit G
VRLVLALLVALVVLVLHQVLRVPQLLEPVAVVGVDIQETLLGLVAQVAVVLAQSEQLLEPLVQQTQAAVVVEVEVRLEVSATVATAALALSSLKYLTT